MKKRPPFKVGTCCDCGKQRKIIYTGSCDACYRGLLEIKTPGYLARRKEQRKPYSREYCKTYRRAIQLRIYDLTEPEYHTILKAQSGVCAICLEPERRISRGKLLPLCVDHDHNTGRVRGLLCWECNVALGKLKDDPVIVRRALAYLEGYG